MRGRVLYVDETKARDYVMVAGVIEAAALNGIRRDLRTLLRPGQRSIHFRKESDRRRREIMSGLLASEWSAVVLRSSTRRASVARAECLQAVVTIALEVDAGPIVVERDDSVVHQDRRLLFTELRRRHVDHEIGYEHLWRHEEPALWLPDAIAWSFARGGEWRRRVVSRVLDIREVG